MGTAVVIPQRNRGGARLWNCLNALCRQTVPPDEIIVSDLSSSPDQLDNIRGITLGLGCTFLRIAWADPRFSRAVAVNCGIRAARSENVVVLDVDCVVAPHYIESYESRIQPETLLMCEHARGREAGDGEDLSTDWGRYFAASEVNPWPRCANGMSMGATRAFWGRIYGIDERFIGWGAEDDHAVWKAQLVGSTAWIDDPLVIHQDHPAAPDLDRHRSENHSLFDRIRQEGVRPRRWGVHRLLELQRSS